MNEATDADAPKDHNATAFRASTEDRRTQIVGIGNLRVMIMKTPTYWFAQGLEIDYAAQGETIEEVKECFQTGLDLTIKEHLTVHDSIEKLLVPAPKTVWREFFESRNCVVAHYSTIGVHKMFPFESLVYYEPEDRPIEHTK